jgi:hypothetical protein
MNRYLFSILAAIVVIGVVLLRFIHLPVNSFSWDVFGYYLYLPATIIHEDIGLTNRAWLDEIMLLYDPSSTLYQLNTQANGFSIKYTQGMAWLYLPFFLIGHAIAKLSSFPADGFSLPYQWSVNIGMLTYLLIGFKALYEVLREHYSSKVAFVTLGLLYLATNLFQMSGDLLVHPHITLFSLSAMLIYSSNEWHKNATLRWSIVIGFLIGFIILTRPTMAVMALVPLCWDLDGVKTQLQKFIVAKWNVLVAASIAIGITSLQFVYWKIATGNWFYFSYDNPGEGLEFLSPYTWEFLFSFRKGWFIYTPLGLVMIYGIWVLFKQKRKLFFAVAPVVIICIYVMSSWSTWYYAGGSFSSRTLVNIYPVLAIGLAAAINQVFATRRNVFWVVAVLITVLNLFQTWQWKNKIIDSSRMTMAYYFKIFGKTQVLPEWKEDLLVYRSPETNPEIDLLQLYDTAAIVDAIENFRPDTIINGIEMMELNEEFTPAYTAKFREITQKDHAWLVVEGNVWRADSMSNLPSLVLHFKHGEGVYKYRSYTPYHSEEQCFVSYQYSYLTPEVRSSNDPFSTYWWNSSKSRCYISQIHINVLEREI